MESLVFPVYKSSLSFEGERNSKIRFSLDKRERPCQSLNFPSEIKTSQTGRKYFVQEQRRVNELKGTKWKQHEQGTLELHTRSLLQRVLFLQDSCEPLIQGLHLIQNDAALASQVSTVLIHHLPEVKEELTAVKSQSSLVSKRIIHCENQISNTKAQDRIYTDVVDSEFKEGLKTLESLQKQSTDIATRTQENLDKVYEIENKLVQDNKTLKALSDTVAALRLAVKDVETSRLSRPSKVEVQTRARVCVHGTIIPTLSGPYHPSPNSEDFIISHDGTLLWKISDFSHYKALAIRNQVTCLFSPPFFTEKFGYKLVGKIYLNGDGTACGTHVSLFVCILRGPYDAILPWPFSMNCSITMISQGRGDHHKQQFLPHPDSVAFQRPLEACNKAAGCPKFLPLKDLHKSDFVKDDTAFFRISVEKNM